MQAAEAIISRIERAAKTEKNGGRLELEWRLLLTVPHVYINIYIYTYMCVYRLLSSYALCRRKRSGYTTNGMETKEGRGIRDKFRGIYYLDK